MNDFLLFFDYLVKRFPVHLEITYCKTCDWRILIVKQGCARDYPDAKHIGDTVILVDLQENDMNLCFAKAHVALKEWLLEFEGGY